MMNIVYLALIAIIMFIVIHFILKTTKFILKIIITLIIAVILYYLIK